MKILFVVGATSIHTVRWVSQLHGQGWDLHIVDPGNSRIHPDLRGVTLHTGWAKEDRYSSGLKVTAEWPFRRGKFFMRRVFPNVWKKIVHDGEMRIAEKIKSLKADVVHSQGTQYSGYPIVEAMGILDGDLGSPWIHATWGSDLYLFGREPDHETKIRRVMSGCDYLVTDCMRDEVLAREFGFRGVWLGVVPGGGGYPVDDMQKLREVDPPSKRNVIAVKGYQRPAGRALTALEALELCGKQLDGYAIVVHSSQPVVDSAVDEMRSRGFNIHIMARSKITDVWKLFGRSRLALGVSRSDGVPNAMLEAMIMGALPVQTNPGGATAEWIRDGENGLLVPHDDPEAIAEGVARALRDADLVDGASVVNLRAAKSRLDESEVRKRVVGMYEIATQRGRSSLGWT